MGTLKKMNGDGQWLAFYNCGEFSGARYLLSGLSVMAVNIINMYNSSHYLLAKNSLPSPTFFTNKTYNRITSCPSNTTSPRFLMTPHRKSL